MISEKKPVDEALKKGFVKYYAGNDIGFDSLDYKTDQQVSDATFSSKYQKTTVDGGGNFSITSSKDGTYYLLVKSKGRKGHNKTELLGKVYYKKTSLSGGSEVDASYNFSLED